MTRSSSNPHADERRRSYALHASAARRRINRLRSVLRIAAATVILFSAALAWSWIGDREPSGTGNARADSQGGRSGALGSRDGYVPVGASLSPFSSEPAVARLDPALREALRQAADDARAEGIALRVNGGWRSTRYQRELLRRAVRTYGSIEVARQYALPPAESKHVTGEAVDVGPTDAAGWLSLHGSEYGLCRVYVNEPWHFEPATVPGGTCPPMISNAAGG
ncbi:MAG TPA: M15 family metallopeptidase [Solirubrobacterales bacterium]|nr:M15 family metallopeptidase [Solirubrobacterales bacterium]